MVIGLGPSGLRLSPLSSYQHCLPKDNMIIGVIEIIVIITMEAVMSRHMVDIERQDIRRLLLDCSLDILRRFSSILISQFA